MEKRCQFFKWLLVGVAVLLIMSIALPGCVREEKTPSEEAAGVVAPVEKMATNMEEEASNGQVAVNVHSVKFYSQITGDLGGTYKPSTDGDVFAIVDLTIRNVSGAILKISPTYVRLLDNQDIHCPRPMLIIAGQPYELKRLSSEELPSGEERRGMVVFTVKEGTILSTVSYTTPKPAIEVSLEDLEVFVPPYNNATGWRGSLWWRH